jgi:hypothetical protein
MVVNIAINPALFREHSSNEAPHAIWRDGAKLFQ